VTAASEVRLMVGMTSLKRPGYREDVNCWIEKVNRLLEGLLKAGYRPMYKIGLRFSQGQARSNGDRSVVGEFSRVCDFGNCMETKAA